jgi:phosphatidylinositol alpha-mannosyltransferase
MRVGIVCPYSFGTPGGVQFHIRDLARELQQRGHDVSVLAPVDNDTDADLPGVVTPAGRAVAVRYNGSVARLAFGPRASTRVRNWIDAGGFDVLHLHEPLTPSLSMLALWAAEGPIVATFHSALIRSRALLVGLPLLRSSVEKIAARIAVSEDARRTLVDHAGGDAVVIPNGVYVDDFAQATPDTRWQGTPDAPVVAFLGRLDEPRKGLPVLIGAIPAIVAAHPGARFLIAGRGEDAQDQAMQELGTFGARVQFLGEISDAAKATLLASADVFVAPQTGGESFGIVLIEAMAAGAAVVASDLGAFRRVLDEGAAGTIFRGGDRADLARAVVHVLADPAARAVRCEYARQWVRRYDWSIVADRILAVYDMAIQTGQALPNGPGVVRRSMQALMVRGSGSGSGSGSGTGADSDSGGGLGTGR